MEDVNDRPHVYDAYVEADRGSGFAVLHGDKALNVRGAETSALCICYRGPYAATAVRALVAHVAENNVETTEVFRSIDLEEPPNRRENSGDYITQIAVPIRN